MVSHIELLKYMLNWSLITWGIGIWSLAFPEFTCIYFLQKSIKGQALTNFLVDNPSLEIGKKCGARNLWSRKGTLDPQI